MAAHGGGRGAVEGGNLPRRQSMRPDWALTHCQHDVRLHQQTLAPLIINIEEGNAQATQQQK